MTTILGRNRAVKTWSTPAGEEKSRTIPCALCGQNQFRPRLSCEGFSYVSCTHCGLVQMNPQPEQAEVTRRYRETNGNAYLSYETENEAAFLRLQELALQDAGLEELKKILPGRRVLDIGCATGALLEKLRGSGWETRGVEICTPSADYARQQRGLDVSELPLEENCYPGEEFDLLLASHLIEHLNDPASFVTEAHRLLSPGGRFMVTTPNIDGFQARLFRGRWRSAIFDHLYLFSVKTLQALLVKAGFTIEKIVTWGGLAAGIAPQPVKRLADRTAKRFGAGDVMLIRACKAGP
ncbi:methyltransferase type 12 [Treponema primitia ZAS-2]|uniref:Methyltransferase type 12 n=1 Tax=Treponema primitia (strain ATCC BAA-887 / DSM 12427 / ZAS-2) TaxID=545694 RepID=F5YJ92_TREPZ|nr:class I SAM-dependent methyltransferase [Treponema primitia]AEF86507.1 methyltransferase type 12 [Treponema primitia ZAS-2]